MATLRDNPGASVNALAKAAGAPWLKPLNSYDRRERCEFQVSRYPSVPAAVFGGVFLMRCGISPLRTCCSKLELPARKTVNYNGFPRRDARLPVETFNKSVRKLSKARAILVGGWKWE